VSGVRVALVVRSVLGARVLGAGVLGAGILGAALVLAGAPVHAQNLDAGKSPAQIFSDTCAACHRSVREVKPTTPGFMRQHYTTGAREAAVMAAYLSSVGSDPRAVQQRKPPSLGAGSGPSESASRESRPGQSDQPRPPESEAALPANSRQVSPTAAEGAKPPIRQRGSRSGAAARGDRRRSRAANCGRPGAAAGSGRGIRGIARESPLKSSKDLALTV
jgi:hypothetical protein